MDAPVFDGHSDIPFRVVRERDRESETTVLEEEFLPAMRENDIMARVGAVYVKEKYVPEMSVHRALSTIQAMYDEASRVDDVAIATTAEEIRRNAAEGTISFLLGMEGAEPLHRDLDLLDVYYRLGVRLLGLTHSRRNLAGDGAALRGDLDLPVEEGGLSAFGQSLVERMNDLGMVVDAVHINELGFWDIVEITDDPILDTHSNCRALSDHPRNLTDDQIEAVAETGGVVGATTLDITFASDQPTLDDFLDHVDHMVDLVGVDHVGVGFDYYEYLLEYFDGFIGQDHTCVEGLYDDSEVGRLPDALAERGYTETEVRKLTWENYLRVVERVVDD